MWLIQCMLVFSVLVAGPCWSAVALPSLRSCSQKLFRVLSNSKIVGYSVRNAHRFYFRFFRHSYCRYFTNPFERRACYAALTRLTPIMDIEGVPGAYIVHSTDVRAQVSSVKSTEKLRSFATRLDDGYGGDASLDAWKVALEMHNNMPADAIRFLMLFVHDSYSNWAFKDRPESPERAAWNELIDSRISTQIQKAILMFPGRQGNRNFLQYYHFWSAVYIAANLIEKGIPPRIARYVGALHGIIYESIVFRTKLLEEQQHPTGLPKKIAYNIQTLRGLQQTEPYGRKAGLTPAHVYSHIAYHIRGAALGVERNANRIPTHDEVYAFVEAAGLKDVLRQLANKQW